MQQLTATFTHQLTAVMTLLFLAYALLLVTWPLFLWMEKRWPVNPTTPRSNYIFNWKIVASNFVLTPVLFALTVMLTQAVASSMGLPAFPYPSLGVSIDVPIVGAVVDGVILFGVAAFLGDFWYYWWHRKQHEWPALWELHKLHHSDEHLNATSIYRSHFFELAGQALVRGLSVGLLFDLSGAPQTTVAIVAAGLLPPVWDFFIHANVRMDGLRHLLPFLSTPQFHWIHHSREPEHQDKNYAIWLPVFDVVFGSYYAPRVDEYPPTGLSTREQIDTLWEAQAGPLIAWGRMLRGASAGSKQD